MINKINSFPTDDGTYMLALPRQGELTDLSGRLTKIIIFASLLQWGIDRSAKQTRSASPRQGAEGVSHRLTDEVSIIVL